MKIIKNASTDPSFIKTVWLLARQMSPVLIIFTCVYWKHTWGLFNWWHRWDQDKGRLFKILCSTMPMCSRINKHCPHLQTCSTLYSQCSGCCSGLLCSAAPSFLLLSHFIDLSLPSLKDLHPLCIVACSLLGPELLHILKEPVSAWRRRRQSIN